VATSFVRWLFPHGVGTRALLSFVLIGACVPTLLKDPQLAANTVITISGWYFLDRSRQNGNGQNGGAGLPQGKG